MAGGLVVFVVGNSLESLLLIRAALFVWSKLTLTALSKRLVSSWKISIDGFFLKDLIWDLILFFIKLLCAVLTLSLRIFFFADLMIGISEQAFYKLLDNNLLARSLAKNV